MQRFASLLLPLPLLLGACASASADYPSLAVRDVERVQGSFAASPRQSLDVPPVETDLSAPLDVALAQLVASTEAAHSEFLAIVPRAERLVAGARGSAIGSPSWAEAEVALSELEAVRSRAAVPLGDVDTLYTAARVAADDIAEIEAARARILAMLSAEDETLARLRER